MPGRRSACRTRLSGQAYLGIFRVGEAANWTYHVHTSCRPAAHGVRGRHQHMRWRERDLSAKSYYVWRTVIYLQARLEDEAQCILCIIGATPERKKELLGFVNGTRESAHDWRALRLDLKRRGISIAPKIAAMARSDSGRRSASYGPRPASSDAGCAKLPTFSTNCPRTSNRRPTDCYKTPGRPCAVLTATASCQRSFEV